MSVSSPSTYPCLSELRAFLRSHPHYPLPHTFALQPANSGIAFLCKHHYSFYIQVLPCLRLPHPLSDHTPTLPPHTHLGPGQLYLLFLRLCLGLISSRKTSLIPFRRLSETPTLCASLCCSVVTHDIPQH